MDNKTVDTLTNIGVAANLAAGHAGEMAGKAMSAAGEKTGCPVLKTAGSVVGAASKAWSDAAVHVGNRDRVRLTSK